MSFANIRTNSQIFILRKGAEPKLEVVTVTHVSERMAMPSMGYAYPPRTAVNITVETQPQQTTYQSVPTDTDTYYCENGQTVLTSTKEAMNNELNCMVQRSEEVIRSVDNHRVIIEACNRLLLQLNPERQEKAKQDEELAQMKAELNSMSERNQRIEALLEKMLQSNGSGKNKKE